MIERPKSVAILIAGCSGNRNMAFQMKIALNVVACLRCQGIRPNTTGGKSIKVFR